MSGLFLIAILISQIACKTSKIKGNNHTIQGLWEGTYTIGPGSPVPAGTSFYFSFSIYPGGKLSYKSKGYYNGRKDYITFADGTWDLNGNNFSFSVRTINYAEGGRQHVQSGSATFNANDGTLRNGIIMDGGATTPWKMTKVN
jgi:hypothetical protein